MGDLISLQLERASAADSLAAWAEPRAAAAGTAGATARTLCVGLSGLAVFIVILKPSRSILKTVRPFFFIRSIRVRISFRSHGQQAWGNGRLVTAQGSQEIRKEGPLQMRRDGAAFRLFHMWLISPHFC